MNYIKQLKEKNQTNYLAVRTYYVTRSQSQCNQQNTNIHCIFLYTELLIQMWFFGNVNSEP
jgi:hypothetical protein